MALLQQSAQSDYALAATLEFAVATDKDKGARNYQEDSTEVWRPSVGKPDRPVLAVLSDGMGGHVSGEIASSTACERFVENFKSGQGSVEQLLEQSLIASNDAISSKIRKDAKLAGMGCTLVAAHITPEGLRWASVGDSMLLLFRGRELSRLNDDHSLGSFLDRQAAQKIITPEEAKSDPRRRTLRSALIGSPIPLQDLELNPVPLQHGDWVIIASDGLETLSGNEIARVVGRMSGTGDPAQMVRALLDEVRNRRQPHQDNVSIIAVHVSDPHEAETRQILLPASSDPTIPVTDPLPRSMPPRRTHRTGVPFGTISADPTARVSPEAPVPHQKQEAREARTFPVAGVLVALVLAGAAAAGGYLYMFPEELAKLVSLGKAPAADKAIQQATPAPAEKGSDKKMDAKAVEAAPDPAKTQGDAATSSAKASGKKE